jgi:hypothetical protein
MWSFSLTIQGGNTQSYLLFAISSVDFANYSFNYLESLVMNEGEERETQNVDGWQ